MNQPTADKLHYIRIPKAQGGRAEMVRLVYVLSGRPYVDVLCAIDQAPQSKVVKNPFQQFPVVETQDGRFLYQTLAIMHHTAHGTPAWPSDPSRLTDALAVAMGGYDLYQAFGGFPADDLAAKKKFEEKRAPQLITGLGQIYASRPFAAGDVATFADCVVEEAVGWCTRRNEVCRRLFEGNGALMAFHARFDAIPAIRAFRARQAAARQSDESV
jgi:glutathione S-transferase